MIMLWLIRQSNIKPLYSYVSQVNVNVYTPSTKGGQIILSNTLWKIPRCFDESFEPLWKVSNLYLTSQLTNYYNG